MPFGFTLTDTIPATPRQIYDAWLDGDGHSAMTGGAATASPLSGGAFTAWDDYISGRNLAARTGPAHRAVVADDEVSPPEDADLQIEVLLEPVGGGTRITLHHSNVPDGHTGYQEGGWQDHYFEPMKLLVQKISSMKWDRSTAR